MPVAKKTVKARVVKPTRKKWNLLNREYKNFQLFLHGQDVPLYSATKQQAEQLLEEIGEPKRGKEYPVILRRDTVKLEKRNTKIAQYWFKVPVADEYGGVWCPIKPHVEIKPEWSIRETELLKRRDSFFLHIAVQKEVEMRKEYAGVLGLDLGINHLVTSVKLPTRETKFFGENAKKIRRHFLHLRKEAGSRDVVKKWGNKEQRKIDDLLHKITRNIVDYAKREGLLIVVGDLEGIREEDRGRIMNEWISKFPFYKLVQNLRYKAKWEGIQVMEVSEACTSTICSKCGEWGKKYRGKFKCPHCGYGTNRDKNGATNIAYRGLGKILGCQDPLSKLGVAVALPESFLDEATSVIDKLLKEEETSKSSAGDG